MCFFPQLQGYPSWSSISIYQGGKGYELAHFLLMRPCTLSAMNKSRKEGRDLHERIIGKATVIGWLKDNSLQWLIPLKNPRKRDRQKNRWGTWPFLKWGHREKKLLVNEGMGSIDSYLIYTSVVEKRKPTWNWSRQGLKHLLPILTYLDFLKQNNYLFSDVKRICSKSTSPLTSIHSSILEPTDNSCVSLCFVS